MEFGRRVTPPVGAQMISNFLSKSSSSEIDTATMYADTETETILGNVGKEWRKENAKMATKINPWGPNPGANPTKMHGFR